STGSGASPGRGAPTRLRHKLSLISPFLVQYSLLQIGASALGAAVPTVCACAVAARPPTRPAPTPRPAPRRTVRRAIAWSADVGRWVMRFSPYLGFHDPTRSASGRTCRRADARVPGPVLLVVVVGRFLASRRRIGKQPPQRRYR